MSRVAIWVLVVLFGVCGVAQGKQAASKLQRWSTIEALPQDTLIEVLTEHQAGPESCRISSVDDNSLTCLPEGMESEARLIFPRSAVLDVWVVEQVHDGNIWIIAVVGFALGAMACGSIGPAAVFICGGIGALMAVSLALDTDQPGMFRVGYPGSIRVPRRPQLHLRLRYRVP